MTWQPGAELDGRYRLEEKIGEGGMGEVWRGKHLALESDVAIKFLGTQLASNEETQQRFRVEAKVTAGLRSRHAVQVFDFGVTPNKEPYIVMELLRGEPLSHRIERLGRLDPRKTVDILRDAAKALSRAHGLGIVHRDFKPDNVFLVRTDEQEDEVKVVDFGIAKLIGSLNDVRPTEIDLSTLTGKAHLTRTGGMVGTPHYMGPEQVRMEANIGPAADIWALGIVAYECLTGRCPFDGDNVLELFTNIQVYRFTKATDVAPTLPTAFDDWFRICCSPNAANRFSDPLSAVDALEVALSLDRMDTRPSGARLPAEVVAMAEANGYRASSHDTDPHGKTRLNTMQGASLAIPKTSTRNAWLIGFGGAVLLGGFAFVRATHGAGANGGSTHVGSQPTTVVTVAPPTITSAVIPPIDSAAAAAAASASAAAASAAASASASVASSSNGGSNGGTSGASGSSGSGRHKNDKNPGANDDGNTKPAASAQPLHPATPPTATAVSGPMTLPPTGI